MSAHGGPPRMAADFTPPPHFTVPSQHKPGNHYVEKAKAYDEGFEAGRQVGQAEGGAVVGKATVKLLRALDKVLQHRRRKQAIGAARLMLTRVLAGQPPFPQDGR